MEEGGVLDVKTIEHTEVEEELFGLRLGVHGSDVPPGAVATCEDDVLAGITVDEAGLVPSSGYLLHEVDFELRLLCQVAGRECEVLPAGLEGDGCGELEDVAGAAGVSLAGFLVQALLQHCAAVFHRGHSVAHERMQAGVARFLLAEALAEVEVFAGQYGL